MKYQRIYFYSSSVQHKGLLPAGLGLRPQDAGVMISASGAQPLQLRFQVG